MVPHAQERTCAHLAPAALGRFGERCRVEARFSKIIDERCKLRVVFHKAHMFCRYERRELGSRYIVADALAGFWFAHWVAISRDH